MLAGRRGAILFWSEEGKRQIPQVTGSKPGPCPSPSGARSPICPPAGHASPCLGLCPTCRLPAPAAPTTRIPRLGADGTGGWGYRDGAHRPRGGGGVPEEDGAGLAPCVPRPWAWAPASQPDGLCSETGLRPLDSSRLCPLLPGGGCALSRGTGPDLGAGPWPGLSRSWLSVFPRSAGNTGRPSLPAPAAATRRPLHVKPPPTQRWPRGSGPSSLTPAPRQPSGPAAPASRSAPARDTLDRHLGVAVGRAWAPKPGFHGALHDLLDETQSCSDSLGSRTPGPVLDAGGTRPRPTSGQGPLALRAPQGPVGRGREGRPRQRKGGAAPWLRPCVPAPGPCRDRPLSSLPVAPAATTLICPLWSLQDGQP